MREAGLLVAILAAGGSRRLGRPKQLVSIDGEPLVRGRCRVALAAGIGPVIAILGCHANECRAAVADLPVDTCVNQDWQEGMAASLRCAVAAARALDRSGLLILACDQYRVTAHDLYFLYQSWRNSPGSPHISRFGEYVGPPAILPMQCYDTVERLQGDTGARSVLYDRQGRRPIEVENRRSPRDIDTLEDLAAAGLRDPADHER